MSTITFQATVRNPTGNKNFLAVRMGRITSQSLAPFIGSDIEVTIHPLLCPVCQHPLRDGKCPEHGRADE